MKQKKPKLHGPIKKVWQKPNFYIISSANINSGTHNSYREGTMYNIHVNPTGKNVGQLGKGAIKGATVRTDNFVS